MARAAPLVPELDPAPVQAPTRAVVFDRKELPIQIELEQWVGFGAMRSLCSRTHPFACHVAENEFVSGDSRWLLLGSWRRALRFVATDRSAFTRPRIDPVLLCFCSDQCIFFHLHSMARFGALSCC
jgi:hypothetical protein